MIKEKIEAKIEAEIEKLKELFPKCKYANRKLSPTEQLMLTIYTKELFDGEITAEEYIYKFCKSIDDHIELERFNQKHYHDSDEEYEKAYKERFGD